MLETTAVSVPARRRRIIDVRSLAEAALLSDVTVLLSLVRVLVPIPGFQGLVRFACPLPFVLLTLRRGVRTSLIATVSSYILLSCFVGPLLGTQILVFGGLGTLFAWASQRKLPVPLTVVLGAIFYGVLYLVVPFFIGIFALKLGLTKSLDDIRYATASLIRGLAHLHFFGLRIGPGLLGAVDSVGPGHALLQLLHSAVRSLLAHPFYTLFGYFGLYSLVNIFAYLYIGVDLFYRLPDETRRDARGVTIDFFQQRRVRV